MESAWNSPNRQRLVSINQNLSPETHLRYSWKINKFPTGHHQPKSAPVVGEVLRDDKGSIYHSFGRDTARGSRLIRLNLLAKRDLFRSTPKKGVLYTGCVTWLRRLCNWEACKDLEGERQSGEELHTSVNVLNKRIVLKGCGTTSRDLCGLRGFFG